MYPSISVCERGFRIDWISPAERDGWRARYSIGSRLNDLGRLLELIRKVLDWWSVVNILKNREITMPGNSRKLHQSKDLTHPSKGDPSSVVKGNPFYKGAISGSPEERIEYARTQAKAMLFDLGFPDPTEEQLSRATQWYIPAVPGFGSWQMDVTIEYPLPG
jgi:hypothetical protein